MRKLIVTAALTGGVISKKENPNLPEQPEEIVAAAYDCYNEGAAIIHIHARDRDGKPTGDPEVYRRIHELIRSKCDAIIQDTTGGGGNLGIHQRIASLDAHPEMASLNMGILWRTIGPYAGSLFSNTRWEIERFAAEMKSRGIKPEMRSTTMEWSGNWRTSSTTAWWNLRTTSISCWECATRAPFPGRSTT